MPDLYVAPPSDYNPVQGEVVRIEHLESGRPVLVVELRNRHRIRAILSNDDIHSDSLPAVGAHIECVQHEGLWSYVRTVDVLQGRAVIGVSGAGLVATRNQATLYADPSHFLGMSDDALLLQSNSNQIRLRNLDVEISSVAAGVNFGAGLRFTGGRTNTPSVLAYQPIVARPGASLVIQSETVASHSHEVDLNGQLRHAGQFNIDDALVDSGTTAATVAPPTAESIADGFAANQRTYGWSAVAGALWYNVRWLFAAISDEAAIERALLGNLGTLAEGLLATLVDGTSLTIPVALRADFFDSDRNIGRTRAVGSLVASDFAEVTVRQIEVVGFQVQAQLTGPLRPTIWSQPYYVYYVDWER